MLGGENLEVQGALRPSAADSALGSQDSGFCCGVRGLPYKSSRQVADLGASIYAATSLDRRVHFPTWLCSQHLWLFVLQTRGSALDAVAADRGTTEVSALAAVATQAMVEEAASGDVVRRTFS